MTTGLAAAELASPLSLPEFLGGGGKLGSAPRAWRRLLRRQTSSRRAPGSIDESGGGGEQEAGREIRGSQPDVLVVEREIPCGFPAAVRGLLAASHGQAVRALAAGEIEDVDDVFLAQSPAGGNENSSGVLRGRSVESREQ